MEDKLLKHPRPYQYESLANYILRLSKENFCEISWLDEKFKIRPKSKFLDKYTIFILPDCMNIISDATNLSYKDVYNMTINSFNLWNSNYQYYNENKELQKFSLLKSNYFCPQCLKENNYEKIYWKLKHIKVCLLHKLQLINCCTNCGKEITYQDIINRKCTCGTRLQDMISVKVNNDMILRNQSRIYSMFNIMDIPDEYKIFRFDDVDMGDYAKFIYYINDISSKYLNFLTEKEFYEYDSNYTLELNRLILIEKIFEDWPTKFCEFIDLANEYNSSMANFDKKHFWLEYFSLFIYFNSKFRAFNIKDIKFTRGALQYYFYTRYNFEGFSKILKPILVDNRFIEYYDISDIFVVTYDFLMKNFNIYTEKDNENIFYADLKEIVNYFYQFINNNFQINEKDISVDRLYKIFIGLDVSLTEIMNLILANKINVKIDLFKNGTSMLYVPAKEAKIAILEFTINKLKNSDDKI